MGNCFLYKRGFGGGFGGGGGGGGEDIPEIEKTASGKIISITDSTEKPLKGLRLFGKTTQNGTPSPTAPVPLESVGDGGSVGVTVAGKNLLEVNFTEKTDRGITFKPMGDGGVRVTGTTQNYPFHSIGKIFLRADVWYRASRNGTVLPKMSLRIVNRNVDPVSIAVTSENAFKPKVTGWHDFEITINPGFDGETTLYPMIELGDTATAYEPYKGGSVTISTPNGLPGIHVSEGGNYTDENGWQWICDEVDFGRGKYVQRVAKGTITEKNFDSIQLNYSSDKSLLVGFGKPFGKENGLSKRACLSDRFVTYHGNNPQSLSGFPGDVEHIGFNTSAAYAEYFYMRIFRNRLATQDAAGVKAWLADNNINVLYQLITPIETPLSTEELAAYAALHTNYPSTTLYNDADSYMEVKYMAKGG